MIDKKLLDILVCPVTKTALQYDKDKQELIAVANNVAYPIKQGIPVMLANEARELDADERDYWKSKQTQLVS